MEKKTIIHIWHMDVYSLFIITANINTIYMVTNDMICFSTKIEISWNVDSFGDEILRIFKS